MRTGSTETPEMVSGADLIAASLATIFRSPMGSRLMRPTFGNEIWGMLFETVDVVLAARVRRGVQQAIERCEPRIKVSKIAVEVDETEIGVKVEYVWQQRIETVGFEIARPT